MTRIPIYGDFAQRLKWFDKLAFAVIFFVAAVLSSFIAVIIFISWSLRKFKGLKK